MIMTRTVNICLLSALLVTGGAVHAQQKGKTKENTAPAPAARKVFYPPVYLGNSDYWRGPIKKEVFDQLMQQGLTAHDSSGNKYKVLAFDFTYAEHVLSEDNTGYPTITTDYLIMPCHGNMLDTGIVATKSAEQSLVGEKTPGIFERTKAGDSVFFDHIKVVKYINNQPEGVEKAIIGRGMKFAITK